MHYCHYVRGPSSAWSLQRSPRPMCILKSLFKYLLHPLVISEWQLRWCPDLLSSPLHRKDLIKRLFIPCSDVYKSLKRFPLKKRQKNQQKYILFMFSVIRDFKHRWRRAQRTTTGSKISPYCATTHARLVVHMKFRTSERQVCRPERTWVCIYVFTDCLR